jgi:hypothetical protein
LPAYASFQKLVSYDGGVFENHVNSPLTPDELCDVVEKYANLIDLQIEEYSCPVSVNMALVSLFPKGGGAGKTFVGMYPFSSAAEAMAACRSRCGDDVKGVAELAKMRGIQGKWHLNFEGHGGADAESYDQKKLIPPQELRTWVFDRRKRLGLQDGPASQRADVANKNQQAISLLESLNQKVRQYFRFAGLAGSDGDLHPGICANIEEAIEALQTGKSPPSTVASGLKKMVEYVESMGLTRGDSMLRTYLYDLTIISNEIRE